MPRAASSTSITPTTSPPRGHHARALLRLRESRRGRRQPRPRSSSSSRTRSTRITTADSSCSGRTGTSTWAPGTAAEAAMCRTTPRTSTSSSGRCSGSTCPAPGPCPAARPRAAPYGIPPTNPFVGQAGCDEIWSYGLRNPWRFSFDRETDDMLIGDVGQNALGGDRLPARRQQRRRELGLAPDGRLPLLQPARPTATTARSSCRSSSTAIASAVR